jgi:hypothetical protein
LKHHNTHKIKKDLPSVDGIKYAWNPHFYNKGWSMIKKKENAYVGRKNGAEYCQMGDAKVSTANQETGES